MGLNRLVWCTFLTELDAILSHSSDEYRFLLSLGGPE